MFLLWIILTKYIRDFSPFWRTKTSAKQDSDGRNVVLSGQRRCLRVPKMVWEPLVCVKRHRNMPYIAAQFAIYWWAICGILHRKAWLFSPCFALTHSLSTFCAKRSILRYFRPRGIPLPNTRVLEGVFSELSLQFAQRDDQVTRKSQTFTENYSFRDFRGFCVTK